MMETKAIHPMTMANEKADKKEQGKSKTFAAIRENGGDDGIP